MMRSPIAMLLALPLAAAPLAAQGAEAARPSLLSPSGGLMFWTLIIFLILLFVLTRYAFRPITAAVEAREQALEEAIAAAKRDRDAAAALLQQQQQQVETARAEAQRTIADARAAAEKVRADLVEQAHREQQEVLERARREIGVERDRAIAELRRTAVDLALRGASKVIERNLDDRTNRELVEEFLASLPADRVAR